MNPLIIGMNNPISDRPRYALWPEPEGCSGNRLWRMLRDVFGTTQEQYVEWFDRRNLLIGTWSARRAREAADALIASGELAEYRNIVLLGGAVCAAFRFKVGPCVADLRYGTWWWHVPHPSGMNRWYNRPENRVAAAQTIMALHHEPSCLQGAPCGDAENCPWPECRA